MKFLSVVTPPYIYHGWSTWKTFWEKKFKSVSIRKWGRQNIRENMYIKNGDQYIKLEIYLKLDYMDNI